MKLVNSMMTIHITGVAGCGKTWAAELLFDALTAKGESVLVVDEYRPSRPYKEKEKQQAIASKPDILIIVEETSE